MNAGLPSRLILSLVLAAASRSAAAQTAFTLPDTLQLRSAERALLRFEQLRSAAIARHDTVVLRRMYADEFRGVTAAGFPVDRERLLGVFALDDPGTAFAIDQIAVRTLGPGNDSAMLTARLTARMRSGELVYESRFLHVYVWRDARWQILAAQGTLVRQPGG